MSCLVVELPATANEYANNTEAEQIVGERLFPASLRRGLSRTKGNFPVRFLGRSEGASILIYPVWINRIKQNSDLGRILSPDLRKIPVIDPEYIQFGCAKWFWERQVNSFVLQIEPERYIARDKVSINYQEALRIKMILI